MMDRRRLITRLGLAALLSGCGSDSAPGGPRVATAPRTTQPDAVPDDEYGALLPARAEGGPLAPLGSALRALESGRRGRVGIVILGDSHVAFPRLAERLRELMQARFGDVGPGRLSPGRAQSYFSPVNLSRGQEGSSWVASNALRSSTPGPFGLTGYRLSGSEGGDRITLGSSDPQGFDRLQLSFAGSPGSGSVRIYGAGAPDGPLATRTSAPGPRLMRVDLARGTKDVTLELVGDGPVDLLGWGIDRRGHGVTVESFGIVSATLSTLDNRDPVILARELQAAPPALVILEFGTNESTATDFDGTAYADQLRRRIRMLRTTLPRSGILLMGVPDAGRPVRPPRPVRGRRPAPVRGCGATPLVSLAEVREVQRRVAASERVGFFDWSAEVTQDVCRLPRLAAGDTPLMRPDLIHFTTDGYRLIAERLHAHLMRGAGLARGTAA